MNLRYPSEERKGVAKEVLKLSLAALILDILVLLFIS
jgi:predicted acetyltransferase